MDESHQDWSTSVRGIPLRRHSSPGVQNQGEPEMGFVPRGVFPLAPTLSRSSALPRWRCHKHAKPFQPQQSQRNSDTAMKNQEVASTLKISCSCIPTEINLQVNVLEEISISGFLCKPLSSQALCYTKGGVKILKMTRPGR